MDTDHDIRACLLQVCIEFLLVGGGTLLADAFIDPSGTAVHLIADTLAGAALSCVGNATRRASQVRRSEDDAGYRTFGCGIAICDGQYIA